MTPQQWTLIASSTLTAAATVAWVFGASRTAPKIITACAVVVVVTAWGAM